MGNVRIPQTNVTIIAGRLTRDPEVKYTQSNKAVCRLGLVHNDYYRDAAGQQVEHATFVDVVCWDRTAEYVGEKLRKGSPVQVEGRLRTNAWTDQEGQKRSKLELQAQRVEQLEWPDDAPGGNGGQPARAAQRPTPPQSPGHNYGRPAAPPPPQRQAPTGPPLDEEYIPF